MPIVITALPFLLAWLFGTPFLTVAFPNPSAAGLPLRFFPTLAAPTPPPSFSRPATGQFLVASRRLGDANFAETVVLLIEYNQNGALGVVINRPAEVRLSTLLPDVEELQKRTDPAYLGGPVGREQLLLLARCKSQPQGSLLVFEDVYTIPGQIAFERIIQDAGAGTKFRAYLGYAGWAVGQLDFEIAQGGWHVVPADTTTVFDKAPGEIWPELIRRSEAQWVRRQAPDLVSLVLINPYAQFFAR